MELKLGTTVPDWARDKDAGRFDGDREEMITPRLQQVQKSSGLVDTGAAKLCDLYSDPHGAVVGNEKIRACFVVLAVRRAYKFFHGNKLVWDVPTKEQAHAEVYFDKMDKVCASPIPVFDANRGEREADHSWKFRCWEFLL